MAYGRNPQIDHEVDWVIDEDGNVLGYQRDLRSFSPIVSLSADNGLITDPAQRAAVGEAVARWLVTDKRFYGGAKGDGISDDTSAINAVYASARALGVKLITWPSGNYKVTGKIDATGVSTQGEGATLLATLDSAISNAAFSWGGDDCFVTGMTFDLSNTNTTLAMQGVFNSVNNASRQRFYNNRVVARTSRANGSANIYGAWFSGTGLTGLYVYNNTFEATSYGFQLNNQDAVGRDVNTNPLGSPTSDVFVYDNHLIDCALGINTPHIFCYNVHIHNNTLRQVSKTIDLPLNVAHVTGLVVQGNNVSCNASSENGTIHIEDVTQNATVSGNVVNVTADNHGIFVGVASGVSQDDQPVRRINIAANIVRGFTSSGTKAGVLLPDVQSYDNNVSDNHIYNFAVGISSSANNAINDNVLISCGIGIASGHSTIGLNGNTFKGCTSIASNSSGSGVVVISGGRIIADTFGFTKNGSGVFLLSNVTLEKVGDITLAANTPFDVIPLPSYKFAGTVNILMRNGFGFSKNAITFDGTTFSYTRNADAQLGSLGGLTLTKSGTTLQAQSSVASGTTRLLVQADGLVY